MKWRNHSYPSIKRSFLEASRVTPRWPRLAESVDRFGLSREAETYELVLALSAFTRRPRSLLDTIAVSIPIVRSFVRFPPRPRSALPRAYLRIHAAHVTHTRWHTPIRGEIYEWHRRLSSNYPPIRLRPTTAYLPAIRRAGRSPPTLGRDCCEPPWCSTTSPHRVHLRTLARRGDTPVCVCVCLVWSRHRLG